MGEVCRLVLSLSRCRTDFGRALRQRGIALDLDVSGILTALLPGGAGRGGMRARAYSGSNANSAGSSSSLWASIRAAADQVWRRLARRPIRRPPLPS